ncbi:DOMON-like domain-containing protein [Ottowia sp.]|uniref:DOMON-like domain-containing protein n=1 Tax=Ottowia sp. TaxID=1898956 RepID=UPI0039E5CACC
MPATPRTFMLQCHPATPCAAVQALAASVAPAPGGGWRLIFALAGELARLRIPAPAARPAAADGLWRHTCLEAFVGEPRGTRYHEFNFSPSGDWAAYPFAAERQRDPAAEPLPPPRIACTHDARSLRLDAWLPAAYNGWHLGLAAVVEATDGSLSYFALAHPREVPDFHQRAGWTTNL